MIHPRLLEIADEAIRAGINVTIHYLDYEKPVMANGSMETLQKRGYQNGTIFLRVDGFYKEGAVALIYNESKSYVDVIGRYDVLEHIYNSNDDVAAELAFINHAMYLRWKDRGFTLDSAWVPLLLKHNLIRAKTQTIYEAAQ